MRRKLILALPLVFVLSGLPVAQLGRTTPHVVFHALRLRSPGVLKATGDFRMLGLSWGPGPAPKNIRFRTSTDGRHFTKWTNLGVGDVGPDASTHEPVARSTEPAWVGHARFADVRWSGRPVGVRLNTIDPGANPSVPAQAAFATAPRPSIITRAQWGADESIRKGHPEYAEPVQAVFVHHTVTTNSYAPSDSAAIVRSIYVYHVQTNGWNDIGYNFLVDRYGQIFEGRYGGMTSALIGAHTLGFNTHSTGIAVLGTFNTVAPPTAGLNALKQLIAWRMDVSHIDPKATTTMTSGGNPRYAAGVQVNIKTISGHRDVYDTDCPGQSLYNLLPSIRTAVAPMGDPKLFYPHVSAVITPNGDGLADGALITGRFSSTVAWKVAVVDPNGHAWFMKSGTAGSFSTSWNGKDPAGNIAPHDNYNVVYSAHNGHGTMTPVSVPISVWRWPDGTLLHTPSGWQGILSGGKLGHVVALRPLQSRIDPAQGIAAPEIVRNVYPAGPDIGFRDGTLVKNNDSTYLISDAQRRPISNATIIALKFDPGAVIDTTPDALAPTPQGTDVGADAYPDGSTIYSSNGDEAMFISGVARPFGMHNVRVSYEIRDVERAGPNDMTVAEAQALPAIGFRDGSLIRAIGTSTVYVISNGTRRSFGSRHLFDVMGYDMANVMDVPATELAYNSDGGAL